MLVTIIFSFSNFVFKSTQQYGPWNIGLCAKEFVFYNLPNCKSLQTTILDLMKMVETSLKV